MCVVFMDDDVAYRVENVVVKEEVDTSVHSV